MYSRAPSTMVIVTIALSLFGSGEYADGQVNEEIRELNQSAVKINQSETSNRATRPSIDRNTATNGAAKSGTSKNRSEAGAPAENRGWATPVALIKQLDELSESNFAGAWAVSCKSMLKSLVDTGSLSDSLAGVALDNLDRHIDRLDNIIRRSANSAVSSHEEVTRLQLLRYAMTRRMVIWRAVHEMAHEPFARLGQMSDDTVGAMLQVSNQKLRVSGVDAGWIEYLELESAVSAFNSLKPNRLVQQERARAVLARLNSPALLPIQLQYLNENIDQQMIDVLKFRASETVDLSQLLRRIEEMEQLNAGTTNWRLNHQYQNLVWSNNAAHQKLANLVHMHYRNANVRFAVSEEMINRLVPQQAVMQEPIQEQILGADVFGESTISNRVRVALVPDPTQVQLRLETHGQVDSRTQAYQSGFIALNEGTSRFRVMKRLAFGRNGVAVGQSQVSTSVNSRLTGLHSNLDAIPLVGWMAQKIARKKIQQQSPVTEQITRNKVETSARSRFEDEVTKLLTQVRQNLNANVLQPLIAMDLDPEPVEISTSVEQVVMRYRLAGRDQMAAYTPRPRALPGSLMSMQIHHSAINNMIQRMDLAGKKYTLPELAAHLKQRVGIEFDTTQQGDREIEFEFARFDPLRLDFKDDRVSITLNLLSFKVNKKKWKKLRIRSEYIATADGATIVLKQDEGISLKGYRLKTVTQQAGVRAIFTTIFKKDITINTVPAQLVEKLNGSAMKIGQFVVSDGWVGISLIDDPAGYRQPASIHARFNEHTLSR